MPCYNLLRRTNIGTILFVTLMLYIIMKFHLSPSLLYSQEVYIAKRINFSETYSFEEPEIELNHTTTLMDPPLRTHKLIPHVMTGKYSNYTGFVDGYANGLFCDNFFHRTSKSNLPVCTCTASNGRSLDSIISCQRPLNSYKTIECAVSNVLIHPKQLVSTIYKRSLKRSSSIKLLINESVNCNSTSSFHWKFKYARFVQPVVTEAVESLTYYKPEICENWINETTLLFRGCNTHVYFEFLAWFGVFKGIIDHNLQESCRVLRLKDKNFKYSDTFAKFEKLLFPNMTKIENLSEISVCFKKLVILPDFYDSLLFRCKMEHKIIEHCFHCSGKNLSGTIVQMFRSHVLKSCSINDTASVNGYRNPQKIVYIRRKPYDRRPHDNPEKFHRVISNSDQLLAELKAKFKANITYFYGEELPLCEQIRIVHDADIYIGVHGAGLVHSWWLQKQALLFEIVTQDKINNKAFKLLTTLVGINYRGYYLKENGNDAITLDINSVISTLNSTIENDINY